MSQQSQSTSAFV